MGFVFYDTETTGTDTSFDQILQFAAVHTDDQFNELGRFEKRCRLLPHVVPAPSAMHVTRVRAAQLTDPRLPSHYEMVRGIREQLLAWSPALFIGYNSVDFDEHLIRQAFYKTLHPPYLTNTNNNSRSDALRIVHATSIFSPNALRIPVGDKGRPVFKLDQIAPLNGFTHDRAHDALGDVEAMRHVCRLISERAPDVWSAFMRFSQKSSVADHIVAEPIFCLSDFFFGRPYSWLVTTVGANPDISSEFFVYNLAIPPDELTGLSHDELVARLGGLPKPMRRLKSNACPVIMPVEDAPAICSARELGQEELDRRIAVIQDDEAFRSRLIAAFHMTKEEREPSPHVEKRLYDGFWPREDETLMQRFHEVPWEERLPLVEAIQDPRLRELGLRLIHLERSDILPAADALLHDRAIAIRMMGHEGEVPWLTLQKALEELDDLAAKLDPAYATFVEEHRAYLIEQMDKARRILDVA
jgi:exodeoxyribonuclease-1